MKKDDLNVFVCHFRRFEGTRDYMTRWDGRVEGLGSPLAKGGVTEAVVVDKDGTIKATGLAICSERDSYNKKIGRDIAIGRALKKCSTL